MNEMYACVSEFWLHVVCLKQKRMGPFSLASREEDESPKYMVHALRTNNGPTSACFFTDFDSDYLSNCHDKLFPDTVISQLHTLVYFFI